MHNLDNNGHALVCHQLHLGRDFARRLFFIVIIADEPDANEFLAAVLGVVNKQRKRIERRKERQKAKAEKKKTEREKKELERKEAKAQEEVKQKVAENKKEASPPNSGSDDANNVPETETKGDAKDSKSQTSEPPDSSVGEDTPTTSAAGEVPGYQETTPEAKGEVQPDVNKTPTEAVTDNSEGDGNLTGVILSEETRQASEQQAATPSESTELSAKHQNTARPQINKGYLKNIKMANFGKHEAHGFSFAVRRDNPQLLDIINATLTTGCLTSQRSSRSVSCSF